MTHISADIRMLQLHRMVVVGNAMLAGRQYSIHSQEVASNSLQNGTLRTRILAGSCWLQSAGALQRLSCLPRRHSFTTIDCAAWCWLSRQMRGQQLHGYNMLIGGVSMSNDVCQQPAQEQWRTADDAYMCRLNLG